MTLIKPFQILTNWIENEEIRREISMYPQKMQEELFNLWKTIMSDELQFVLELEKRRNRRSLIQ
jgi:hypothetical protein